MDVETEEYYFTVNDIVQVLTESTDVKQYVKRMRSRDPELYSKWGTICTPLRMLAPDGKMRLTIASKPMAEDETYVIDIIRNNWSNGQSI